MPSFVHARSPSLPDVTSLRRSALDLADACCPVCRMPFDQGMKRKITDACSHERCYTCMTQYQDCPLCTPNGGPPKKPGFLAKSSGGLLGSALGASMSSLLQSRPKLKTSGQFAAAVQARHDSGGVRGRDALSGSPLRDIANTTSYLTPPPAAPPQGLGMTSPPVGRRRVALSPRLLRLANRHQRAQRANTIGVDSAQALADTDDDRDGVGGCGDPAAGAATTAALVHQDPTLFARLGLLLGPAPASAADARSGDSAERARSLRSTDSSAAESRGSLAPSDAKSSNTSPVSTLTGSSESELAHLRSDRSRGSFGSLMSMSLNGSTASISPLFQSRRNSLGVRGGSCDDLGGFGGSRSHLVRRSARCARVTPPVVFGHGESAPCRPPAAPLSLRPLFHEVPQRERQPAFVGRRWLFAELERLLVRAAGRGCVIAGSVGTGKTAALLQLVEHSCFGRHGALDAEPEQPALPTVSSARGIRSAAPDELRSLGRHLVAYHFCQADNSATCLVPDFVHSVAAQLCQAPQLAAYRDHVVRTPALQTVLSLRSCVVDPGQALVKGVLDPLHLLRRSGLLNGEPCLLVVDALCQAEYHRPEYGDNLAAFLGRHLMKFPSWLKLVVTVRTQMQGIASLLPFHHLNLDRLRDAEPLQQDLAEYITFRVNSSPTVLNSVQVSTAKMEGSGQARFVAHLAQLSRGSFLFVKLTLDLIESGHLVLKSSSFKVLPVSLSEIFLLHFNLKFPTQRSFELVQPILSCCLASLSPMNAYQIYHSVNASCAEIPISWEEFLRRFKLLSGFLVRRRDDTYMMFHSSFREWLTRRDEGESNKFLLDVRQGHASIALRFSRLEAPLDAKKTLELGHHVLKAHLYKNSRDELPVPPRDLQALWMAMASDDLSAALVSDRNVVSPNVKVSSLLLMAGADVNTPTRLCDDAPLLGVCARHGHDEMLQLLLRHGAAVEQAAGGGLTALMLAAGGGQPAAVQALLQCGARVAARDAAGRCALVHAAAGGHLSVAEYLLWCDWPGAGGAEQITLAEAAQQATVAAAGNGHLQLTEYLLDMEEVSVNSSDTLHSETPLTMAAAAGHKAVVEALLRRGANVAVSNVKGSPALQAAVRQGHWDISVVLLQHGADMEQPDAAGRTALMAAAGEGHVALIDLLLTKGASVTVQDGEGLSALCWACLKGQARAVRSLLEAGAEVTVTDGASRTPLDLAAFYGDADVVLLLLDHGAVLEHVDARGMRPLDRAIACGHLPVVQAFLRKGAKLGASTWTLADDKLDIMFALLSKLNDDGMTLYKKSRVQEADHRFTYALRRFPAVNAGRMAQHEQTFRRLHVNLLLNLSRCKRRQGDQVKSEELCTQAMDVRPEAFEPYFFRAKAKHAQNELELAAADLAEALRLAPSSREVRRTLLHVQQQLQQPHLRSASVDTLAL